MTQQFLSFHWSGWSLVWLFHRCLQQRLSLYKIRVMTGSLVSRCFHFNVCMCNGTLTRRQNCGLRMRLECRERFPYHRLHRKPLVSDSGIHHGTCVTHVPWCVSGSLARSGGKNVPGIPGACANLNFTYLVRGPWVSGYFCMMWFNYCIFIYVTNCHAIWICISIEIYLFIQIKAKQI